MPGVAEPVIPRRILFVSTVAALGGGERCLLRLLGGLDRHRWSPLLAAPPAGPLATAAGDQGVPVLALHVPEVLDPEVVADLLPESEPRGRRLAWRRRLRTGWRLGWILAAGLRLASSLARQRVALVHANSPRATLVGGLAGRVTGRPVLTHVRDIVHSPFERPFARWALDHLSDRFVAASEATARVIACPDRTDVVYDGLEPLVLAARPSRRPPDPKAPEVAMVAVLSPWKGHEVFLHAARRLLDRIPGARFTIVGGDLGWPALVAYRRRLEGLVDELGLRPHVDLAGPRTLGPSDFAAFDVFVHPPLAPDPFPAVVLEAAAAGCPIVATAVGGIPEIVEDGTSARLVPPGRPDALAEAVLDLLRDPSRARCLGEAARARVQRFTLARTVSETAALYDRLLAGR
jgi:glycosyltransferase involved in cell wall biosynthesis